MIDLIDYLDPPPLREELILEHQKRIDPSIYQLPPKIIEEAKKAKDPEWQIELACLNLRTQILLTTNMKVDSTRAFIECVRRNKWKVKQHDR